MEDDFMKPMMGIMMAVLMIGVLSSVVGAAPAPTPVDSPPAAQVFECPLEPGLFFDTYEELYQHFITDHPTEPIDIVWG